MQTLPCDRPGSLITETIKLVNNDPRGLLAVYTKTGVPFYWLRKFASGQIPNPSVNRVQYLFEKLTNKRVSL